MIKFVLSSTHGDQYYIGLNGIQIYDERGSLVSIASDQIHATPFRDLNDLEEIRKLGGDERVLDNLIDVSNDTYNDRYLPIKTMSSQCF